ncbi:hypothetical protein HK096_005431 [Nowakowskiella sp. JEL0078]|nr:hypothetical protein HK096_005431 [Nowakowskiella sp. JEL0078]
MAAPNISSNIDPRAAALLNGRDGNAIVSNFIRELVSDSSQIPKTTLLETVCKLIRTPQFPLFWRSLVHDLLDFLAAEIPKSDTSRQNAWQTSVTIIIFIINQFRNEYQSIPESVRDSFLAPCSESVSIILSFLFRISPFTEFSTNFNESQLQDSSISLQPYKQLLDFIDTSIIPNLQIIRIYEIEWSQRLKSGETLIPTYVVLGSFCMCNYLARFAILFPSTSASKAISKVIQEQEREILKKISLLEPQSVLNPFAIIASHFLYTFNNKSPDTSTDQKVSLSAIFKFMKECFAIGSGTKSFTECFILDDVWMRGWRQQLLTYSSRKYDDSLSKFDLSLLIRDWLFVDFVVTKNSKIILSMNDKSDFHFKKINEGSEQHSPDTHNDLLLLALKKFAFSNSESNLGLVLIRVS